jgi:carboxymethylenebutenolidase
MPTTETIQLAVSDGTKMNAYVARPEGARKPGLILLQEAFGVNGHIRDVARRLAGDGYVVVAPELFHRTATAGQEFAHDNFNAIMPHMQAVTVDTMTADMKAAYDFLAKDKQSAGAGAGAIGFCMGGRAAWVANAKLPLKAAVAFYGGRIAPDLLNLAADQHGPILLGWGGLDAHIPSTQTRAIDDALVAAKKNAVSITFQQADHAFCCDDRPNYHPAAAREAWALIKEFLKTNLSL